MTAGGPYPVGQRFGPYELTDYLGAGAFKTVYRARNDSRGSGADVVALGFPHQQDPEGLAELEKEFVITSRLSHPNILRVFALERHEQVSFLVMEYLEGETLRAQLRQRAKLPPDLAVRYVGLLCDALAYAHTAHVFHRDVKPENVFVTADGLPKLLDFGVARLLARTGDKASTRIGTVEYMPPEQLQGAAGTNADLWAVGVTLYEMLTGERPFDGEMGAMIQKILVGRYDEAPLHRAKADLRLIRMLRKMLDKDPERRYATADEVVRDLEALARQVRVVDDDESRLEVLIRASVPLVAVASFEEGRVLSAIRAIAARLSEERRRPRRVYLWSASRGLRDDKDALVNRESLGDPLAALQHMIQDPEDAIYVFLDMHRQYSPVATRLLRDAARAVRTSRKSVLLVSPAYQLPEELRTEVSLSIFQLPDPQSLEAAVARATDEAAREGLPVDGSERFRQQVARAGMGLTLDEAERALRKAVVQQGGFTPGVERVVIQEKTQVIRKSGVLEYYDRPESLGSVGGLDRLIQWFDARAPVFAGTARYAGLPQPKGVLLVGVPGCGKSLSARALAGAWGVPLLRMDVGRLFGSLMGESESNLHRAIQTAEAVSPCILWIDEVEKGFAGVKSHSGGGVAARVFGAFLQWLQDKRSPVFVVATANDLTGIPPEFLRQGRFDETFFVGLPGPDQRESIFKIHLAKRGRRPEAFDLGALVRASEGFAGAEVEQGIVDGLFRGFDAGREVETADILAALAATYPLSRSRPHEIAALMAWAAQNAKSAA